MSRNMAFDHDGCNLLRIVMGTMIMNAAPYRRRVTP
jgi:hypothetical protein